MLFTLAALSACDGESFYYGDNNVKNSVEETTSTVAPTSAEPVVYEDVVALLNNYTEKAFPKDESKNATYKAAYDNFAFNFLKTVTDADKDKNVCLSPFSAYMAFSLCFMGADNETLEEFENVFGLSKTDAAKYCQALYAELLQTKYYDNDTKVNVANSVWVDNGYAQYVKEDYLKNATEYFNAPVYRGDFKAQETVDALNDWCSEQTDGLIKEIIKEFGEYQVMALVNALLIEAGWEESYSDYEVKKDVFTNNDMTKTQVDFLCRTTDFCYRGEDSNAFKIPLKDGFSFVGILPNEDVSIDEYLSSLTAEKFNALLSKPDYNCGANTRIPKFNIDYNVNLVGVMMEMGITAAFDDVVADFRLMGEKPGENLYIGSALQKTHFELDEKGIKAAAVTYIGMNSKGAVSGPREIIDIFLDRPFIYALMDDATGLPLFIGTIKEL